MAQERVRIIGGRRALEAYRQSVEAERREWEHAVYYYRDGTPRRWYRVRPGKCVDIVELRIYSTKLRQARGGSTRTANGNPLGYVRWSGRTFREEFGVDITEWRRVITPEWLMRYGVIDPTDCPPEPRDLTENIRYEVSGDDLVMEPGELIRLHAIDGFRDAMRLCRTRLVREVPVTAEEILEEDEFMRAILEAV